MNLRLISWAFALLFLGMMASCKEDEAPAIVYPDVITVNSNGLRPEGVDFDKENDRFLLGSTLQAKVYAVDMSGNLTAFIEDPDLTGVIGIHIDAARNRVLVCNSQADFGSSEVASLGVYDLETGNRIAFLDLAALTPNAPVHFANDAAVDANGNIYVTDSQANVVYKVDGDYNASIFAEIPGVFFNGIEFVDNTLLIAEVNGQATTKLYRSDLSETTPVVSPVQVDISGGLDGIILNSAGNIVCVSTANQLVELSSSDSWMTASIVNSVDLAIRASTVTQVSDAEYFVCNPQFDIPIPDHATVSAYTLTKVSF